MDDPSKRGIDRLLAVCDALREPGGCPWDREQTRETLRQFVIEEAYEVVDAIDARKPDALKEELGDLLFQVVFHARIAKEEGRWDFDAVAAGCADKLVRRHPHVFGPGERAKDAEDAYRRWEEIKANERGAKAEAEGKKGEDAAAAKSALSGLPAAMPALLRAQRTQEKVARTGFDWESIDGVWGKLDEESRELREAVAGGDRDHIEAELGDLLFTIVNLGRFLGVVGEDALRRSVAKFADRFRRVEDAVRESGQSLQGMTLPEMDAHWERAKRAERQ